MTDRPNVLWIMADQLRFDDLSCYGNPHLHTWHIDALAARGGTGHQRRCAIARLRPVAHVRLYGPLCAQPWLHVDRDALAGGRADARRSCAQRGALEALWVRESLY